MANEGYVDIAAVGNEVLYRGELTEYELLSYIERVKAAIPHVPVGYVDTYYEGEGKDAALPSQSNAIKYFIDTQLWSKDDGIEVFYFSSFDEAWKVGSEGEVGAYWGIWDSKGQLKKLPA